MMRRVLILTVGFCLLSITGRAQHRSSELTAGHLAKAEKVIALLERLDGLALDDELSLDAQAAARRKLLSSIRRDLSAIPDSDLKIDLATALLFYEREESRSGKQEQVHASSVRCENERPGMYRKLCETTQGGARSLMRSKARLHTGWARATLDRQKGMKDTLTESALNEMKAERQLDAELAESAVRVLMRLEDDVLIYRTLGEFMESGKLAQVSFERFNADLEETRRTVGAALCWLPESRLKSELRNAMLSYLDGRFWWKQVYRPKVIYAGNSYTAETATPLRAADLESAKYTVVINWRQARQYTSRAAQILKDMKG